MGRRCVSPIPRMGRVANQRGHLTGPRESAQHSRSTVRSGFLSSVFNPKSIIFFVSVVPHFIEAEPGAPAVPIQMTLLGSLYVGIATIIHVTIVMMAVQLKPWLIDGRRRDVTLSFIGSARHGGGLARVDNETLNLPYSTSCGAEQHIVSGFWLSGHAILVSGRSVFWAGHLVRAEIGISVSASSFLGREHGHRA